MAARAASDPTAVTVDPTTPIDRMDPDSGSNGVHSMSGSILSFPSSTTSGIGEAASSGIVVVVVVVVVVPESPLTPRTATAATAASTTTPGANHEEAGRRGGGVPTTGVGGRARTAPVPSPPLCGPSRLPMGTLWARRKDTTTHPRSGGLFSPSLLCREGRRSATEGGV